MEARHNGYKVGGEDEDDEHYIDYDMSPDEEELEDEDESDELDDLEDPRITELPDDEEEVPTLIKKENKNAKKGANKRQAEDSDEEPATLDDIMSKALKPAEPATNGEVKLSKKQRKKLKNNAGQAVEGAAEKKDVKKEEFEKNSASTKADKKVQFAKQLEQGPSLPSKSNGVAPKVNGTTHEPDSKPKKDGEKQKPTLGVKTVQGVKIDDKKLGTGRACKNGDKVGMRYIGKLESGKVFDGEPSPSAQNPPSEAKDPHSKQERPCLHVQTRPRRRHQRLGHWRRWHVRGRGTPHHHPREPGLRQQGHARESRHPPQFPTHL